MEEVVTGEEMVAEMAAVAMAAAMVAAMAVVMVVAERVEVGTVSRKARTLGPP